MVARAPRKRRPPTPWSRTTRGTAPASAEASPRSKSLIDVPADAGFRVTPRGARPGTAGASRARVGVARAARLHGRPLPLADGRRVHLLSLRGQLAVSEP